MTRALPLSLPLAAVAAVLLAAPPDTEACFRRRAAWRPCPCPPPYAVPYRAPCVVVWPAPYPGPCPAPWPAPYPPAFFPSPVPGAAPGGAPVRTVVSPKGRTYRLTPSGDRGSEEPDLVTPPTPFAAKDPDAFIGVSRLAAKTSYVGGEPTAYPSVAKLRADLPSEKEMLALKIPWGPGSQKSDRVKQEKRNVTVFAYVYAYKKEPDQDYHVLIGDAPGSPGRQFLNAEVSGLPGGGPYRARLKQVRDRFKGFYKIGPSGPDGYVDVSPPTPVRITGSIFFDMDHAPPRKYVGYKHLQPKTAWEVHPITDIEFDAEP